MPLSKKRLLILCITVVLVISISIVIAKHLSSTASRTMKEGKIKQIRVLDFSDYEMHPDMTIIEFEDGEMIEFIGQIEDIQTGRMYRIVYHEQQEYFRGVSWSGKYNVIDSIEEVK